MTALDAAARREGHRAMEESLSRLERVFRQSLAGAPRKKDLKLTPMGAIAEGRKLRERVTGLMRGAESDPADARVYCVFVDADAFAVPDLEADPDLTAYDEAHFGRQPRLARLRVSDSAGDVRAVTQFSNMLPIGFLIFMWDRNAWKRVRWTIRPLIVEDHSATTLNAAAMRSEQKRIETKLAETGGVFPDDED